MNDIIEQFGGFGLGMSFDVLKAYLLFACVFLIYYWFYELVTKKRQQSALSFFLTIGMCVGMGICIVGSSFVPMFGIKFWMPWLLYMIAVYSALTTIIYY